MCAPMSKRPAPDGPFRQIGNHRLRRVLESVWTIDVGFFFRDARPEAWEPHLEWLGDGIDPDGWTLRMPIQGFLVETPTQNILVDTCVGAHKHLPQRPEWNDQDHDGFLAALASHGLGPEDIDMVLCTHMHLDHTGWNTRLENGRWVPTFPNATYIFAEQELDYWIQNPTDVFRQNILPVLEAGQARRVAQDHALTEEIRLVPSPGHSPGHVCVEITSEGQSAVLGGDVMHSPIQCRFPEWHSGPDMDKAAAVQARLAFLNRYCGRNTLVCLAHFPLPSAGFIQPDEASYTFEFDRADW
jgi:glyoxylase-like metal-dependent hydrolase (beta-lactamase superfamily II)